MPRKHRTPASSSLNRENQRRSRTRHREFVQDLQSRLFEYERRGVQASVELQRVARAVARENIALRGLLAAHGISPDEINACTTPPESTNDVPVHGIPCAGQAASQLVLPGTQAAESPSREEPSPRPWDKAVTPQRESHQHCTQDTSCSYNMDLAVDSTSSHMSFVDSACYHPPEPLPTSLRPLTATLEMPCEEAATILAQLRGQTDSTFARGSLGCYGTSSCFVKNTKLLQLMDEIA